MLKLSLFAFGSLTLVLFFASLPKGGEAVKCYVCNSMNASQGGCGDEFRKTTSHDRHFLKECADGEFCRKQSQNIRGEVRTIRSCGKTWNPNKEDGECLQTNMEEIRLLSCQCRTDMCNGVGTPAVSMAALFLPALLLLFKTYL